MRLMLVDDERRILAGLEHIVRGLNTPFQEILCACSGPEALTLLESGGTDLLITDIVMPGMDGIELIRQVRQRRLCTHFAVLSGYQEFEYARGALQQGAVDYLLKPLNVSELEALLARCAEEIKQAEEKAPEALLESANPYVQSVILLLRKRYAENLTLAECASHAGVHPNYLSTIFKQEMDMPLTAYLMHIRVDQAKRLLKARPDLGAAAVAEMVGFREPRAFYKAFRQIVGTSPSAFRKDKQTENSSQSS